jgi:hypothetical protein
MRTVPDRQRDAIEFFAARLALWEAAGAELGLKADVLADMADRIAEAEAAEAEREASRIAARNATVRLAQAMAQMRELGGEIIRLARVRADLEGDESLLAATGIPPARPASRLGPPPQPTGVTARLKTAGLVDVRWRCTRHGGTGFSIERSLSWPGQPAEALVLIATAETTFFRDDTLPTGLASVQYRITAHRSGGSSPPSAAATLELGALGEPSRQRRPSHETPDAARGGRVAA